MTDDDAARKTYRYVRMGMVGAVLLLGTSVLLEHHDAPNGCWQTSISAYYYTPARAIFVGALLAIGLSLIVIKGSSILEDAALNVAGMLAPVVALVPTSDLGSCWSIPPTPLPTIDNPTGDDPLAGWVIANIDNNIRALLVTGFVGLLAAAVVGGIAVAAARKRGERRVIANAVTDANRGIVIGLVAAFGALIASALLFEHWTKFSTRAHGYAAAAMFVALAVAAGVNAWECRRCGRRWYAGVYAAIAVLMIAGAGFMATDWDHKVLIVEVVDISLFALFWSVQTKELWTDTLRAGPASAT